MKTPLNMKTQECGQNLVKIDMIFRHTDHLSTLLI